MDIEILDLTVGCFCGIKTQVYWLQNWRIKIIGIIKPLREKSSGFPCSRFQDCMILSLISHQCQKPYNKRYQNIIKHITTFIDNKASYNVCFFRIRLTNLLFQTKRPSYLIFKLTNQLLRFFMKDFTLIQLFVRTVL